MNEDLEKKLSQALRPVDPGEAFTARVLASVAGEKRSTRKSAAAPTSGLWSRLGWLPAALAASAVLAIVATHEWQAQREQAGIVARDQVIEALRMTSKKLDLVYQAVNEPPAPASPADPGA